MNDFTEASEHISQDLETIGDYIRWVASQFSLADLYFGHGTDNPWDEAAALVFHVIDFPSDFPQSVYEFRLSRHERKHIIALAKQRIETRQPLAYVTGESYFCGMPFYVNEHVLVPRSPIAELIESEFSPWLTVEPERILDLCTGSGCIGIAAALAFPEAKVDCSDISSEALAVAQRNCERHEVGEQVSLIQSDVFDAIGEATYDIIVSNPPYVDAEDMANLPEEYRTEPELALAAGDDGLIIVDRILKQAGKYLRDNGILICEVGNSDYALIERFPDVPFVWLEFERGGDGVFLLTGKDLHEHFGDASA